MQGSSRATCRFTMARAVTSPPPHTAEESVVSGHTEVRTTASGPIHTASPSITGRTSVRGPEADEEVGAEGGKATHLRVRLVEDVLGAGDQVEPVHPPELLEETVGAARVPACVPAVVDVTEGVELVADGVDLREEGEPAHRLPGQPRAARVARDAGEGPARGEVVGVRVGIGEGEHEVGQKVELRARLHALGTRLPRVDGPTERGSGNDHAAGDEIGEVSGEPGELETDAVLPEALVEPRVPGLAPLRKQVGVAE